jgi:alkylated DNA repair protein (DNA oxidative demethylase)
MVTPGGPMSVMTNCGSGLVTDRTGYRYDPRDPKAARRRCRCIFEMAATGRRGFAFVPDPLISYEPGARLSGQDERDYAIRRIGILGRPLRGGSAQRPAPEGTAAAWRCRGVGRPYASSITACWR